MEKERFRVMSAAEFMVRGPRIGSIEHKNLITAEEQAKRDREQRRRERLARMTPAGIERERSVFEQHEHIAQMKRRLKDKQAVLNSRERLPKWLQ